MAKGLETVVSRYKIHWDLLKCNNPEEKEKVALSTIRHRERGSGNRGSGVGSGHGGVEKGPELGVAGVQGYGGRTAEYPLLEELQLKRMRVWRCWVFVLLAASASATQPKC
ncbi:hypothetical protein ACFX2G_043105 [Malus domestica]